MAKILEVKTMKGSRVIAKIAGMESTAKRTSLLSTTSKAINKGVAAFLKLIHDT